MFPEEVEVGDQGDLLVAEPDVVVPEVAVHQLAGQRGESPFACPARVLAS